jgi:methyltransferase-like protein
VILRLALSAGIEILTEPRRVGRDSDPRPEVCRLVRLEAQEGQDRLSSRQHVPVSLPAGMLQLLPHLDGTRSRGDIVALVAQAMARGALRQDGKRHGEGLEPEAQLARAGHSVDELCTRLEANALIVASSA